MIVVPTHDLSLVYHVSYCLIFSKSWDGENVRIYLPPQLLAAFIAEPAIGPKVPNQLQQKNHQAPFSEEPTIS